MYKVFTAFSDYDSQCLALQRVTADFDVYDCDILKIERTVTPSNIYDLAGNSVVVGVWEDILRIVHYQLYERPVLTLF